MFSNFETTFDKGVKLNFEIETFLAKFKMFDKIREKQRCRTFFNSTIKLITQ